MKELLLAHHAGKPSQVKGLGRITMLSMTKVVMGDCHAAFVESHRAVGLTIEDI